MCDKGGEYQRRRSSLVSLCTRPINVPQVDSVIANLVLVIFILTLVGVDLPKKLPIHLVKFTPESLGPLAMLGSAGIGGAGTFVFMTFAGLFLVMASDGCGVQGECSTLGLTAGVGVSALGPWVGVLGLGAWAVVRVVRRRLAWWTALAALVAVPALWAAGAGLVWLSVGGASA